MKSVIARCPICAGELVISRLACCSCNTKIETELTFPALMRLPRDLQAFVLVFLRCRGNIREVEKELGISYPTVCKRLDVVNDFLAGEGAELGSGEGNGSEAGQGGLASGAGGSRGISRGEVLARLERGEITAREAAELLKGR